MGTVLTDQDPVGWNEDPTEMLTDLTGRESWDAIFRRRCERMSDAYYAGVAAEVIAKQAASVIVAVHRSRVKALWMFLEVLGLKGWVEGVLYFLLGVGLLAAGYVWFLVKESL